MTATRAPDFLEGLLEIDKTSQILVSKLPKKTTETDIQVYFTKYGLIVTTKVKSDLVSVQLI